MNGAGGAYKWIRPDGYSIDAGNLLLATLVINILSLALPVMTLQVYDRILPGSGSGTLFMLVTGVCVAIILEVCLRLARSYALGWAGAVYEHRVSCNAINHILHSDLSCFGLYGIGENLERMASIGKLKDFYNGYKLTTLFELVFVPVFLGVIIYIAGPLAFVPSVILMAFVAISLYQGQKLRAALRKRDRADGARYNFLIEGLEGIHTLKSFALENMFSRRYEALQESSTVANYDVTEEMAATFNAGAIFSHIMVAAVIAFGAYLALQGQITTGGLIATVLLSGRMMQPVQRVLALWAKYQDFTLAREKVETLFDARRHAPGLLVAKDVQRDGALEVSGLYFRHGGDGPWMFEDAGLSLTRGESVLLSAGHGAGKTTFLEIICGLYPPVRGSVKIDGQNIGAYPPEKIPRHVGYIQTEGVIFRGTIRDNLTCFGQIGEKNVREIGALLKLDNHIAKLPAGLDTFLSGNNMDNITPGLKQRIAMVRALASRPRLILFDDADRALDREGYHLVYNLLARLAGKTAMIIISDDYNLQSLANRAITLVQGRFAETAFPSPAIYMNETRAGQA